MFCCTVTSNSLTAMSMLRSNRHNIPSKHQFILFLSNALLFPQFYPLQRHKLWLIAENNQQILHWINVFNFYVTFMNSPGSVANCLWFWSVWSQRGYLSGPTFSRVLDNIRNTLAQLFIFISTRLCCCFSCWVAPSLDPGAGGSDQSMFWPNSEIRIY